MSSEPASKPLDIPARVGRAVEAVLDRKGIELRVLHLERVTEVTEEEIVEFFDEQKDQMNVGDQVRARHILIAAGEEREL